MAKANGGKKGASVQPQKEPNKPAHEIRMSRIKATAWRNSSGDGTIWYSVTLQRTYKDKEGAWRSASSLGADDLLMAAEVLRAMRWWIARQYQAAGNGPAPAEQPSDETPATTEEPIPF